MWTTIIPVTILFSPLYLFRVEYGTKVYKSDLFKNQNISAQDS